jgi:hypothetical protein
MPFTEADALRLLPDAERIEGTDVTAAAPSKVGSTGSTTPHTMVPVARAG